MTTPSTGDGRGVNLTPQEQEMIAKRRIEWAALDERQKLIANLRALSDAPGHTATIISIAADELQMAWAKIEELEKSPVQ